MLHDKKNSKNKDELIFELQSRLDEAEQTINAIQNGEIDAIITPQGSDGPKVYTLESADTIYRNLIEEMGDGVATLTPDGIIFYCNAQLAVLLDVPLDKTIGLRFGDFVVNKDLEKYNSIFNRGLNRKSKGEITIKSTDGTVRPVLISINNLRDQKGVYIVVTDLTEQMHHEELKIAYEKLNKSLKDLSSTESLLSAVTNLSSELIYVKDDQSRWIYVNPALERVIGKNSKELLGKNDLDIYSDPEIGRKIIENDKRIMGSGKEETLEEVIETPNGLRQFISVKTPRINHKKEVIGIVGISHDITDRKKADETLKRQATLLDASYEAIFSWEYGGEILSWNKGAERLYGYTAEETIGKIGHDLLKTEFPVEFDDFISKLGEDEFWKGEIIHTTKNGQKIVVETHQQLIKDTIGKEIVIETNRDITERKNAEESVNQAQKLLQDIINGFPSPIFVKDIKGRFLIINNKLEELLGVKNNEVRGKTDDDIITRGFADIYRANDMEVIENGEAVTIEEEAELIDGHHTFIAHKFPIFNTKGEPYGVGSVSTDITERKILEEELEKARDNLQQKVEERTAELKYSYESLKESKKHYMTLFNSIDEGFCTIEVIFDSNNKPIDYRFLEVNPAFEKQTGLENAEGKLMRDLAPDHEEYWFEYYGKVALKGEPLRFVKQAQALDKWYDVYAFKIGNEESKEVAILFNDITKFKKLEKELREYQETLEEKVKERTKALSESNKELEQFAYITSHDLREPLRMITSFLQLLERRYQDKLDQDAKDYIGFAVDGAKRLDAMTNDLLEYSRITSSKREISPVNFEYVLEEALLNLKIPIKENKAVITHDPLPIINGNEKLKVQLFQNLIGNAIKYHGKDNPQIHVSAKKEKNQYLFSIKDNGIGISPDHLEKIFTIFKRLHTHEEYEGTGIGLSISQKIVHQQGGEIWVESELGKGSTFYFTIPIN